MSEKAITRRSFLAGSAGVATLVAGGFVGFGSWKQAKAAEKTEQPVLATAHSMCNACSSKCGFTAYTIDGKLRKLIGDAENPMCKGKLCARGYGYSQIAYSKDRLTDPLRKNERGEFEAVSWDQAYSEIAEKVASIIGSDGPQAIAAVQDPRPSGKYYTTRFVNALGSANVYTHAAACDLSRASGFLQTIGASTYSSDIVNSKMTMFIGRNYADAIRPSSVAQLQQAHESGARIVIVDPRCNNTIAFADEWVPINPGTDLALILSMAHVLVAKGLYDQEYVKANGVGFDDWAAKLVSYTPTWAERITGISAGIIERLALEFAEAAPAASIEQGWRAAIGSAYRNSGETARAVCLFNTLLGCWNQKGGALFTSTVNSGALDEGRFPKVPKPAVPLLGLDDYPLANPATGSVLQAAKLAKDGAIKGMFFYQSNMAAGYANPAYLAEALGSLDLMVVIDVQMSETAMLADYVLPDTSYLERTEIPEFIDGMVPAVALRDQVIDKVLPNTRPVDQIYGELAEACGVGEYFPFTVEELADAQLRTVGLSLESLREVGTSFFADKAYAYGAVPIWNTPTGKIQFTSDACVKAGLTATPEWLAPSVMPGSDDFRLIGGKQPIHSHTQTTNIEDLMQITKDYDLTRVWMNADRAAQMGISDGDTVQISSSVHSGTVRVKVTERLNPTALWIPSHYGCSSPEQHTAYGVGLRQMDFVPFHIEPAYGSAMTEEVIVTVKKVGA